MGDSPAKIFSPVTRFFGLDKPNIDKVDTSGIEKEKEKAEAERQEIQEEEVRRRRSRALRQSGRLSLFSGLETGIPQRTSLG